MKLKLLILNTCKVFDKLGVEYALIGGYSAIIYGSPYLTGDIDFILSKEKVNFDLLRHLKKIGWESTEEYTDIRELQALGQFIHKDLGVVLHIFTEVSGFKLKPGIKVKEVKLKNETIQVCSPEDYLVMRACIWDEEDKFKAIALVRAQKEGLDISYLMKRAQEERVKERVEWILKQARKEK